MDAATFLALWRDDPAAARAHAATLGPAAAGFAAELARQFPASDARGTYTYWLRQFRCPPVPPSLARRGWAWDTNGTELRCSRQPITVADTGQTAIDVALQIETTPAGRRGQFTHGLTDAERAARLAVLEAAQRQTVQMEMSL